MNQYQRFLQNYFRLHFPRDVLTRWTWCSPHLNTPPGVWPEKISSPCYNIRYNVWYLSNKSLQEARMCLVLFVSFICLCWDLGWVGWHSDNQGIFSTFPADIPAKVKGLDQTLSSNTNLIITGGQDSWEKKLEGRYYKYSADVQLKLLRYFLDQKSMNIFRPTNKIFLFWELNVWNDWTFVLTERG